MAKKVRIKDNGYNEFFAKTAAADQLRAKVGVQGNKAAENHPGTKITFGALAVIHEFGAPRADIPERSHFRATADTKRAKYQRMSAKVAKQLVRSPKTVNVKAELFKIGETYRSDVIDTIKNKIPPPLAASTLARRPFKEDIPLANTGQYIGSIRTIVGVKGK